MSGNIVLAKSYDPYGVNNVSSGAAQTSYGFTGEQTDTTGMVYLRARYYAPGVGRFISKDSWDGSTNQPMTFNLWNYSNANPVNHTDPDGNSIYSGICMGEVFTKGLLLNISARKLIEHCKDFYTKNFWKNFGVAGMGPFTCPYLVTKPWIKPTSAGELFKDYICETGPEHMYFDGSDRLTHLMADSVALDRVRKMFYRNGGDFLPKYHEDFTDIPKYIGEWADLINHPEFPLVHLVGSFIVSINQTMGDRIRIQVDNRTDLASGTHFIGRTPPPGQASNPYSLENYIQEHPDQADSASWWLINNNDKIISILSPETRADTGPGMGGGNLYETFTWTESKCWPRILPWPFYLWFLNIGNDIQIAAQ